MSLTPAERAYYRRQAKRNVQNIVREGLRGRTGSRRGVRGGNVTRNKISAKLARSRTITKTKTKKNRVYKDDVSGDLTRSSVQSGRMLKKNLAGAWKQINANMQHNVYGVSRINRFMSNQGSNSNGSQYPPGFNMLGQRYDSTTLGSGQLWLPLVLWNISATPNLVSATPTSPRICSQLIRTANNLNMSFYQDPGASSIPLNTGGNVSNSLCYPNQIDFLKAFSAKLVLYGCIGRPVIWKIDIVQILQDNFHPDYLLNQNTGNSSTLPGNDPGNCVEFYDELTKSMSYSPASFHNGNATKGKIKFLKSWTHIIQPRLTTESLTTITSSGTVGATQIIPHSHVFNLYHRLGRTQRYNWSDNVTTTEPTTDTAADNPPQNLGLNRTDVTYKARVYLMLRALAPEPSLNEWRSDTTPSYDISFRTYHQNFD